MSDRGPYPGHCTNCDVKSWGRVAKRPRPARVMMKHFQGSQYSDAPVVSHMTIEMDMNRHVCCKVYESTCESPSQMT